MSQYSQPNFHPPVKYPAKAPPQENGWGIAGFIVSVAGLFLCGIPSIVGAMLSLIGLRKEPRGLAIAGFILGLLGVLEILVLSLFLFTAYRVAESGYGALRQTMIQTQLELEASVIGNEWESTSSIPTQAEGNELLRGKRDMVGNSIVYETDGESFSLRSAGPDGILETEDDTIVGPYRSVKAAQQLPFSEDVFDDLRNQLESMEGFEDQFDDLQDQLKSMEDAMNESELQNQAERE